MRFPFMAWIFASLVLLAGCKPQMGTQPKYLPYGKSDFFADGAAMRPLPPNTVSREHPESDDAFHTGLKEGKFIGNIPVSLTKDLLARGQNRYNIYCSVCHGLSGRGDGMIVQRGFPTPPSYHDARLREAPSGYFFYVMTRGYGAMYPYASRVPPSDRWAIVAYIRALQLSQHAALEDVPMDKRLHLEEVAQ